MKPAKGSIQGSKIARPNTSNGATGAYQAILRKKSIGPVATTRQE